MAVELGDNIQQGMAQVLAAQGGVYGIDVRLWWRDTCSIVMQRCRDARMDLHRRRRRSELAPAGLT